MRKVATVSLAGALGLPVWAMLTYFPDWRYLTDENSTRWYPTMRLFKNSQQISSVSKAGTAVGTGAGVKIGIGNQSISALAAGPGNEIRPFDGRIDEVRIYDRGLSSAELRHVAFDQ